MKSSKPIRNPFYADIQAHGVVVDVELEHERDVKESTQGRPRRGEVRTATSVRSIRLPVDVWSLVKAQADREGISLNAAMRQAARIWLRS